MEKEQKTSLSKTETGNSAIINENKNICFSKTFNFYHENPLRKKINKKNQIRVKKSATYRTEVSIYNKYTKSYYKS